MMSATHQNLHSDRMIRNERNILSQENQRESFEKMTGFFGYGRKGFKEGLYIMIII